MRGQRPPGAAPAIAASAEALPLDDDAVDAAMACVTIHHWAPLGAGLAELRRVARGPVVVFTFDLDHLPAWQLDHLAPGLAVEGPRFPPLEEVAAMLGGRTRVETIPTPADCTDGFFEAYWRRPEAMLDPSVRASQSMWALLPPGLEDRIVARLAADLASGAWDAEHGHLRAQETFDGAHCASWSPTPPEPPLRQFGWGAGEAAAASRRARMTAPRRSSSYWVGVVVAMKSATTAAKCSGSSTIGKWPAPSKTSRRLVPSAAWAAWAWATGMTGSRSPQTSRTGTWAAR